MAQIDLFMNTRPEQTHINVGRSRSLTEGQQVLVKIKTYGGFTTLYMSSEQAQEMYEKMQGAVESITEKKEAEA